jgi:hypothetical protein
MVCPITKYGLKGASDAEDNENWFWDALGDLHDDARRIIAVHLARLGK